MTAVDILPTDAPALIVTEIGSIALGRRLVPELLPGHAPVEDHYSGVSVGTELRAMIVQGSHYAFRKDGGP